MKNFKQNQRSALMNSARSAIISVATVVLLASCASTPSKEESLAAIKSSFNERGIAKLDRLDQTEIQRVCSEANLNGKEVDKKLAEKLQENPLPERWLHR
jgi:L-cysteine S-thiosulfotransferase